MKYIYILLLISGTLQTGYAQTAAEVLFDDYASTSDNDLANFFEGDYMFYQIPTDGITGGSIKIDTNYNDGLWNTDDGYAFYDEIFPNNFDSLKVSICFKYGGDNATGLPAAMLRVRTLPSQEDTSYSTITNYYYSYGTEFVSRQLNINDGYASSLLDISELTEGKWYRQNLKIVRPMYDEGSGPLTCTGNLEDLGMNGTSEPISLGSYTTDFESVAQFYAPETNMKIGICGNKDGGAQYLDNFNFSIYYPSDPSLIPDVKPGIAALIPTVFSNRLSIVLPDNSKYRYSIYDISGKVLSSGSLGESNNINTESFAQGIYFFSIQNAHSRLVKKIIKQ